MTYNPQNYWEKHLSGKFSLSGVGHTGFSEYYNKWLYRVKNRALKKALFSEYIDIHNVSVCDIGCETGFFVEFYKLQRAKKIVGIDITNISIKTLKQRCPEYHFIKEDISSPLLVPKVNHKFDIFNVFDVLYDVTEMSNSRKQL